MDEMDFQGGHVVDFHGVGMVWAGDMTGAEMMSQLANAYAPVHLRFSAVRVALSVDLPLRLAAQLFLRRESGQNH